MAEGVPLLRVYMGNRIEGSNPSFSAIIFKIINADDFKNRVLKQHSDDGLSNGRSSNNHLLTT